MRRPTFWGTGALALVAIGVVLDTLGFEPDQRTFVLTVPCDPRGLLAAADRGRLGWTDAEWLDDRGFSAG